MTWSTIPPVGLEAGTAVPHTANRAVRDLRSLMATLVTDPATSARVALADTRVRIELSDGLAFTLYLDREPVEMGEADDQAEIALAMTATQLEKLIHGELALAMEIAHGRIAYSGPVRKFLRVVPILRRVAQEWMADPDHDPDRSPPAAVRAPGRS
jgi:putative sterol carrier protein